MKFKKGQIINFAHDGNIFMKLIRFRNLIVYGCLGYSHSGIITEVKRDVVKIHEAVNKGFVSTYYPKEWIENRIKEGKVAIGTAKKPLTNVHKHADKYLGKPYGWFDIFNIIFAWIIGRNSRFFRYFAGSKALICSEAVARILYDASNKKIDFVKEFGIPYDMIEPQMLYVSKQISWQNM